MDCLTRLWRHLPENSKKKFNHDRRRRKKGPRREDQKITLPEDLRKNLSHWTADYRSFFNEIEIPGPSGLAPCCPIAMSYRLLLEAESRKNRDTIRMRFLKVLFYHLKVRLGIKNLGSNTAEWISQAIRTAGLGDNDLDAISSNIKGWIKVGARYDALCRDLGNYNTAQGYRYLGSLFRLPDDITDRSWVWELYPSTAANRFPAWKKFQWTEKPGAWRSNL